MEDQVTAKTGNYAGKFRVKNTAPFDRTSDFI